MIILEIQQKTQYRTDVNPVNKIVALIGHEGPTQTRCIFFDVTRNVVNVVNVVLVIEIIHRTVVNLNPGDVLPCERALGVNWNTNDDKVTFKIKISQNP
jgi:hypothetical protein